MQSRRPFAIRVPGSERRARLPSSCCSKRVLVSLSILTRHRQIVAALALHCCCKGYGKWKLGSQPWDRRLACHVAQASRLRLESATSSVGLRGPMSSRSDGMRVAVGFNPRGGVSPWWRRVATAERRGVHKPLRRRSATHHTCLRVRPRVKTRGYPQSLAPRGGARKLPACVDRQDACATYHCGSLS